MACSDKCARTCSDCTKANRGRQQQAKQRENAKAVQERADQQLRDTHRKLQKSFVEFAGTGDVQEMRTVRRRNQWSFECEALTFPLSFVAATACNHTGAMRVLMEWAVAARLTEELTQPALVNIDNTAFRLTAMEVACAVGHTEAVEWLWEQGFDPCAVRRHGGTLISPLMLGAWNGHLGVVKLLTRYSTAMQQHEGDAEQDDSADWELLAYTIGTESSAHNTQQKREDDEDETTLAESLQGHSGMEQRVQIRARPCANHALHFAVAGRHPRVVSFLLDEGADIDTPCEHMPLNQLSEQDGLSVLLPKHTRGVYICVGLTPLGIALKLQSLAMVSLLLEHGARSSTVRFTQVDAHHQGRQVTSSALRLVHEEVFDRFHTVSSWHADVITLLVSYGSPIPDLGMSSRERRLWREYGLAHAVKGGLALFFKRVHHRRLLRTLLDVDSLRTYPKDLLCQVVIFVHAPIERTLHQRFVNGQLHVERLSVLDHKTKTAVARAAVSTGPTRRIPSRINVPEALSTLERLDWELTLLMSLDER